MRSGEVYDAFQIVQLQREEEEAKAAAKATTEDAKRKRAKETEERNAKRARKSEWKGKIDAALDELKNVKVDLASKKQELKEAMSSVEKVQKRVKVSDIWLLT